MHGHMNVKKVHLLSQKKFFHFNFFSIYFLYSYDFVAAYCFGQIVTCLFVSVVYFVVHHQRQNHHLWALYSILYRFLPLISAVAAHMPSSSHQFILNNVPVPGEHSNFRNGCLCVGAGWYRGVLYCDARRRHLGRH